MADRPYYNLFRAQQETWDPETARWAITWRPGQDGRLEDGSRISLTFGHVDTPQHSRDLALVAYAELVDRFPALADRLRLVRLPCVLSRPDDWLDAGIPSLEEARAARRALGTSGLSRLYL